jgi:acetylglutamate synthase
MNTAYHKLKDLSELDIEKFKHLILWSFGRKISDNYEFERATHIYIAEEDLIYQGVLVGQTVFVDPKMPNGILYIDKLAVCPPKQTNGVADTLLEMVSGDHETLFLRAGQDNTPANRKYQKRFGEPITANGWNIYLKGVPAEIVDSAVNYAANKTPTLEAIK